MTYNKPEPVVNQIAFNLLPISGIELGKLLQDILLLEIPIRFRATGNSMKPFILEGDILTIAPFSHKQPDIGTVVAYINQENKHILVHRIIAKKPSHFLIKADNSFKKTDGWVKASQIFGRVIAIERNKRNVHLGLGLERFLIAFLSKHNLLIRITQRIKLS